jgi:hypothetical protein
VAESLLALARVEETDNVGMPAEHVEDAVENADDVGMYTELAEDVGDVGMSTDLVEDVGNVGKCSIKGCGYPFCQAVKDGTELPSIDVGLNTIQSVCQGGRK